MYWWYCKKNCSQHLHSDIQVLTKIWMVVFVASNFAALCLYLVQTISNIFILRVLVHSRSMYRYGKFVSLNDKEIFDIVWQFRLFLYLYEYHQWNNNLNMSLLGNSILILKMVFSNVLLKYLFWYWVGHITHISDLTAHIC